MAQVTGGIESMVLVGSGLMGSTISASYAASGVKVTLVDVDEQALANGRKRSEAAIRSLVENGLAAGAVEEILGRMSWSTDLEAAVSGVELVQEAVPEVFDVKTDLLRKLDSICDPGTVLATNTSSFRVGGLGEATKRPDKVVGFHFIYPPHILKPVEVVRSHATSQETVDFMVAFARQIHKVPIICKDTPGFVINRVQLALSCVAHWVVDQGIATAEQVDEAMRLCIGPRLALWGPLRTEDLVVNKRTTLAALEYLKRETGEERYEPAPMLKQLVQDGSTGLPSGKGWYDYTGGDLAAKGAESEAQLIELLKYLEDKETARFPST